MKQGTATTTLVPTNLQDSLATFDLVDAVKEAQVWRLIVADMLDDIVRKPGTYVTLGLNRNKTSVLLTVTGADGTKQYASGDDLHSLMADIVTKVSDNAILATME